MHIPEMTLDDLVKILKKLVSSGQDVSINSIKGISAIDSIGSQFATIGSGAEILFADANLKSSAAPVVLIGKSPLFGGSITAVFELASTIQLTLHIELPKWKMSNSFYTPDSALDTLQYEVPPFLLLSSFSHTPSDSLPVFEGFNLRARTRLNGPLAVFGELAGSSAKTVLLYGQIVPGKKGADIHLVSHERLVLDLERLKARGAVTGASIIITGKYEQKDNIYSCSFSLEGYFRRGAIVFPVAGRTLGPTLTLSSRLREKCPVLPTDLDDLTGTKIPIPFSAKDFYLETYDLDLLVDEKQIDLLQLRISSEQRQEIASNLLWANRIKVGVGVSSPALLSLEVSASTIFAGLPIDLKAKASDGKLATFSGALASGLSLELRNLACAVGLSLPMRLPSLRFTSVSFHVSMSELLLNASISSDSHWPLLHPFVSLNRLELAASFRFKDLTTEGSFIARSVVAGGKFLLSANMESEIVIVGRQDGNDLPLSSIISHFGLSGDALPLDTKVSGMKLIIIPASKAFSFSGSLEKVWSLKIPTLNAKWIELELTSLRLAVDNNQGGLAGSFEGALLIGGKITLKASVRHPTPNAGWIFYARAQNIPLKEVAGLLPDFKFDSDLTIEYLSAEADTKTQSLTLAGRLKWKAHDGFLTEAEAETVVSSRKGTQGPQEIEGFIRASADLRGLPIGLYYSFAPSDQKLELTLAGAKGELSDHEIVLSFGDRGLGEILQLVLRAALGRRVELPPPFHLLNDLPLKGLKITLDLKKKELGFTNEALQFSLLFLEVSSVGLTYNYGGDRKVHLRLKGKFLGQEIPEDSLLRNWDLTDKKKDPPAVPGLGSQLLDVGFIGLGQRVSVQGSTARTVAEAIQEMKAAFTVHEATPGKPLPPKLAYDAASSLLFGLGCKILQTFELSAVFNDPQIYGLAVRVDGPRAGTFKGLAFEILYRKVSESVGVFHGALRLPDGMRTVELGPVSLTIPSVVLDLYTNGSFFVDLGFPHNGDFSQSCAVQVFPFLGNGGLYFGSLQGAAAADALPQIAITKGRFDPVLRIGLGLRLGVGRSIQSGLLSAELSLTASGVFEGVLAFYQPTTPSGEDVRYYRLQGAVSIAGVLRGSVQFAIASAAVDAYAAVTAWLVLEAYKTFEIALEARVAVAITVSVGWWIFKVDVNLSFSTSVEARYVLGQAGAPPWLAAIAEPAAFRLPAPVTLVWEPITPEKQKALPVHFMLQSTVSAEKPSDLSTQKPRHVAMLYLRSSKAGNREKGKSSDFEDLLVALFLWTMNAAFCGKPQKVSELRELVVGGEDIRALQQQLSNLSHPPFRWKENVAPFLKEYFGKITISLPPQTTRLDVAPLPMLPALSLTYPGGAVDFREHNQVDPAYLDTVLQYFAKMAVQYRSGAALQVEPAREVLAAFERPLSQVVFEDFLLMLARGAVDCAVRLVPPKDKISVGDLEQKLCQDGSLPNLAGLAARLLLHGMRPPAPGQGNGEGAQTEPLFLLTGQEFAASVPGLASLKAPADSWITAPDPWKIEPDQIQVIEAWAKTRLAPEILSLRALPLVRSAPARFPLPERTPWRGFGQPDWPEGKAGGDSEPATALRPFPPELEKALREPRVLPLRLSFKAAGPERTVRLAAAPAACCRLGCRLALKVSREHEHERLGKPVPGVYRLEGTDTEGSELLDRLFSAPQPVIESVRLLYPAPPNDAHGGLRSGDAEVFAVRSNLSSETAPAEAEAPVDAALSTADPWPFLRLVRLAGTLRGGGFTLFYRDKSSRAGLPDSLFNQQHTTVLTLLLVFGPVPAEGDAQVPPYANCLLMPDIDPSQRVFATASPQKAETAALPPGWTLSSLAARYRTTVTDLALENAGRPLTLQPLDIPAGVYLVRSGETYETIAAFWGTEAEKLKQLNGNAPLHFGKLIKTPSTVFQPLANDTLETVARRFGMSVCALASANRDRPGLLKEIEVQDLLRERAAAVSPGHVGFELVRKPAQPEGEMEQLFQLLGFRVADAEHQKWSGEGFPVGPTHDDSSLAEQEEIDLVALQQESWTYRRVVPAFRYLQPPVPVSTEASTGVVGTPDPYTGTGRHLLFDFYWQDTFGNKICGDWNRLDAPHWPHWPPSRLPVRIGYVDPLIPLSHFPAVAGHFSFKRHQDEAILKVELSFDATRYKPAPHEAHKKRARADRESYGRIAHQLAQPDLSVVLKTSLDFEAPHPVNKADLLSYLGKIGEFLKTIEAGQDSQPPKDLHFSQAITASHPAIVFAITVTFELRRDPALVGDEAVDIPGVAVAGTLLSPQVGKAGEQPDAPVSWLPFARDFEKAFRGQDSSLKVAMAEGGGRKALTAVRFGKEGIQVKAANTPPRFFAVPPAWNRPLTRTKLALSTYRRGQGLVPDPSPRTFKDVDLDALALRCLETLDETLSPRWAVPVWRLDEKRETSFLPALLETKKKLAVALRRQAASILDDGGPPAGLESAREALEQEALRKLRSARHVDAVLQLAATVTLPPQAPAAPVPLHLLIVPRIHPQGLGSAAQSSCSLQPARLPLLTGTAMVSFLLRTTREVQGNSVPLSLTCRASHLECAVPQVEGGAVSHWLTFLEPLELDSLKAQPDVPILRHTPPRSPSLVGHRFFPGKNGHKKPLLNARAWEYAFTYDQTGIAPQDDLYVDIHFSEGEATSLNGGGADLCRELLQFAKVRSAILEDWKAFLPRLDEGLSSEEVEAAGKAVESLKVVAEQVAAAWASWPKIETDAAHRAAAAEVRRFRIHESSWQEGPGDTSKPLLVSVFAEQERVSDTSEDLPLIQIDDYKTIPLPGQKGMYVFKSTSGDYLMEPLGRSLPRRTVVVSGLDVLIQQSAWAGVRVTRNERFSNQRLASRPFVYETPQVRFVDRLTPLLEVSTLIDVAKLPAHVKKKAKKKLDEHLLTLWNELFDSAPSPQGLTIICSYHFRLWNLNWGGTPERPDLSLPILLKPAFVLHPDQEEHLEGGSMTVKSLALQLAEAIANWKKNRLPLDYGSYLLFEVVADSLKDVQRLPVLRLRSLCLKTSDIDWT